MECVDARTGLTTTYKGIWRADQLEGLGRIKFPNGDSFKGMLKNGQPNGHGELKQGRMGKTGLVTTTFFSFHPLILYTTKPFKTKGSR